MTKRQILPGTQSSSNVESTHQQAERAKGLAAELAPLADRRISNAFLSEGEPLPITILWQIVEALEPDLWREDRTAALAKVMKLAIGRLPDELVRSSKLMSIRDAAKILYPCDRVEPLGGGQIYPILRTQMLDAAGLMYESASTQGRAVRGVRDALANVLLEFEHEPSRYQRRSDQREPSPPARHHVEADPSYGSDFWGFVRHCFGSDARLATSPGPLSYIRGGPIIGGAAPLYVAPRGKHLKVTLEASEHGTARMKLTNSELAKYNRMLEDHLAAESDKADEPKVSVDAVRWPTMDSLELGIEWHVEPFSRARTFHWLLSEVPALYARLAPEAADFESDSGPHWPNILCMHSLILLDAPEAPHVLLSQRQKRGQRGSYSPGKWSASIEEQVVPGERLTADTPPRGLAEELMRDATAADAPSRFVAAILETEILNLALVQVIQLRRTFAEVVESWPSAADSTEHSQLIAVPLRTDLVVECIATGALTPKARELATVSDPAIFARNTAWDLHPTSAIRMALALWQLS